MNFRYLAGHSLERMLGQLTGASAHPSIDHKGQMTTANLDLKQLQFITTSFACAASDVTLLAGDGSSRMYYRIGKPFGGYPSLVVMKLTGEDHEQLRNDAYPFTKTHAVLENQGFLVPKIVAKDGPLGLIVLEDFGDETLHHHLLALKSSDREAKKAAYTRCFKPLTGFLALGGSPQDRWQQWRFDEKKLGFEFDFFLEHYVKAVHGHQVGKQVGQSDRVAAERDRLCAQLAADSHYFCHRDFHSKNIMVPKGRHEFGIIDFQDARLGPASYDAVSLFFDPYAPLTLKERYELYDEFCAHAQGQLSAKTVNALKSLKSAMILQRLTKALGSFGYLTLAKKRGDYLVHEGPALSILLSLKELPSGYPEIMAILAAIAAGLAPPKARTAP